MNKYKRAISMTIAIIYMMTPTITYADTSPSFARNSEQWDRLRDNKLEYDEIEDLIIEYNPTVVQNHIDYVKFVQDYGTSKDDISSAYNELADEISDSIDYPDESDVSYATKALAAITSESTVKTLRQNADNNLEDAEIKRLSYEMAMKSLVQVAQNKMIDYYNNQYSISISKQSEKLAKISLDTTKAKKNAGMATEMDILSANENYLSTQQALTKAVSSYDATRRSLLIMCGWNADSDATIGDVPEPELSLIESMTPDSDDKQKAIDNNYTLRINKKKLENATSQNQIDSLKLAIESNERSIAASVTNAYNNVISARDIYNYAKADMDLQKDNMIVAEKQYAIGSISKVEYETQQVATDTAICTYEQAKLSLLSAINSYNWSMMGLASAS